MRKFKTNLQSSARHITEANFRGSNEKIVGRDGNINAGSTQEVMQRLVEIASMIGNGEMFTDVSHAITPDQERSSREIIEEAYHDPNKWAEIGAGLAGEVQERMLRDGFMRTFLQRGDVEEGNKPRIRVRTPNVQAVLSRGIAMHWPQFVRDKIIEVDEIEVNATPEVNILEMHQNSGDILEDKYYEAMEAIFAGEDRLLLGMMRTATGIYNPPTYFSGAFTPAVLQGLRQAVTDWVLPVEFLLIANDLISDLLVGNEFSTWFDPITKWEIVQTGRLGSILGLSIITDGYREPVLKVLEQGEAFVTSSPLFNGVYTDRGPVISTPIDGLQQNRNTKGWNLYEIISATFANAKAVATAKKI